MMQFQYIGNNEKVQNIPERGKRKCYIYKVGNHQTTRRLNGSNEAMSQN